MGDWNICIRGTGAHHNEDYPQDANRMARLFVHELIDAGHAVKAASFTHGGEEDLIDGAQSKIAPGSIAALREALNARLMNEADVINVLARAGFHRSSINPPEEE